MVCYTRCQCFCYTGLISVTLIGTLYVGFYQLQFGFVSVYQLAARMFLMFGINVSLNIIEYKNVWYMY